MKLEYVRASFDSFTAKAGEIVRQLAFAGIAIIWIFKIANESELKIPNQLYLPLSLFCLSLLTDLLQYVYGSVMIGVLLWRTKAKEKEDQVKYPKFLNIPTWIFFTLKIILLIVAYGALIMFLFDKLLP